MKGVHGLFGKLLVGLDVCSPVVRDEGGTVGHGVEKWPECTIAAAIVIAVEKFRLCVDRNDL